MTIADIARSALTPYMLDRLVISDGCWVWNGPIDKQGYGVANLPGGKRERPHRVVWKAVYGDIPDETLDHTCHDPRVCTPGKTCPHRRCCNPEHLEPLSRVENSLRGGSVGGNNRRKERCPKCGGEYSVTANGWRRCAPCIAQWRREQSELKTGRHREAGGWTLECVRGHVWADETTRWSSGKRYCKICDRENNRLYKARRRQRLAEVHG